MGRVGSLATALGIGIAVATGFCAACATAAADTGDRNPPSGGSDSSTSQSVESGARSTSRSGAPSAAIGGVGTAASRAATTRNIPEEFVAPSPAADGSEYQNAPPIRIDMPEPVMAPASPTAGPTAVVPTPESTPESTVVIATGPIQAGTAVPALAGYAPVKAAPTSALLPVTALSVSSQSAARLVPQPTIIVSPPGISASLATTLRNIVAALTEAWPGGAPAVPVDASLVSMLGTARREDRAAGALRTAVTVPATAAKTAAAAANTTTTGVEAEKMAVSGAGRSVTDRNASGGYAIALSGAGKATATVTLPAGSALTLRLRSAAGAPNMTVSVDGVPYTTLLVEAPSYADYTFAGGISAGTHIVSIPRSPPRHATRCTSTS